VDEIDRVLASGARFGCVLADAEYGKAAGFPAGLDQRLFTYAVGVLPTQKVHPADMALTYPSRATDRLRKHPMPSAASMAVAGVMEGHPEAFRSISWRTGIKGPLKAEFASLRYVSPMGQSRHVSSTCQMMRLGSWLSTASTANERCRRGPDLRCPLVLRPLRAELPERRDCPLPVRDRRLYREIIAPRPSPDSRPVGLDRSLPAIDSRPRQLASPAKWPRTSWSPASSATSAA
jgi:hypothetical protein